jgi:signal transduction histidine kinase
MLAAADQDFTTMQVSTYVALALILCIGSGMGMVVYRNSIAPLHERLRESQRQLQRREKLAALGELAAAIAHEIRNPLSAIKARLFTLGKVVAGEPSATEDATVISEEIDRLERILRKTLQFARPLEPVLAAVDPVELLRHVRNLVWPDLSSRGIGIELDATPAPAACADRDLIAQGVLNLVHNAAHAIGENGGNGSIWLRAAACGHPRNGRRRQGVRLEVSDDGPGIPPEAQDRLFDPFFTTKPAGTGLGLSVTAQILEGHGGRVDFKTQQGRGTTFALVLPVAPS